VSALQLTETEHAIWRARPHEVVATALDVIVTNFDVADAEVYLADYRLSYLIPVTVALDPQPIDDSLCGRAFAAQEVITETPGQESDGPHRNHLPLTVHGDRLGVLTVSGLRPLSAAQLSGLTSVATVLARALKIADSGTDLYRRIRRRSRLTLAAEMQWELLPGRSCVFDEYTLAGQLEPAYAVWGDNYDWSAAPDRLVLTVSNGSGQGTQAALLTHLAISAMRNARRSGADLVDQAMLANEIIHSHHGGDQFVPTLLLEFTTATGRVRAVDAGSPQLWRQRGGAVELIELDEQLPLGMFNDTPYTQQEFFLEPGDRLIVVSDGVHAAADQAGELYGAQALARALRDARMQSPAEVVRTLIRSLVDYHQGAELLDDAVVVCLDWRGAADATPDPAFS
jgi:serine phosphatase RsbU (regulator of sigma subunit)